MSGENIWIEPCGCGITEFNAEWKEVRSYTHDLAIFPDGVKYAPFTEQTSGVDANGSPIPGQFGV